MRVFAETTDKTGVVPEEKRAEIRAGFETVKPICEKVGLRISALHAADILAAIDSGQIRHEHVTGFSGTIRRELSSLVFLQVSIDRIKSYQSPRSGWEGVIAVFPDAQDDVEEMNKCYALSRYAATVFHSLLVVEHGLIKLGHYIGVTDPKPGWDATYRELDRLLRNRTAIPAGLDFNFLEQTKARLDSMKLAWRNKVNHAAGHLVIERTGFSDVSAEEVIIACRSFMRHLAEGLPR